MEGCFVIEKPSEPFVMGVSFGQPVIQQQAHMVLKFVEIDRLFEENSAAHHQQIIEQGGGQVLGKILRFVQERGAKSSNVSHVTKHVLCPRFCYARTSMSSTET